MFVILRFIADNCTVSIRWDTRTNKIIKRSSAVPEAAIVGVKTIAINGVRETQICRYGFIH